MTQSTPGWQTPGQLAEGPPAGPPDGAPDPGPLPADQTAYTSPTPPPPPPPTWYGETTPLPTLPARATVPGTATPSAGDGGAYDDGTGQPPQRRGPRRWVDIVVAAVVAAVVAGGTAGIVVHNNDNGGNVGGPSSVSSAGSTGSSGSSAPVQQASGTAPDWQVTAAAVQPSVVAITVGSSDSGSEAQGSGIILDTAGHVLTNNHVATAVDGPITVTLTNQNTYKATIVGADPTTDLAVIKITNPPSNLKPASLGNSAQLTVGQPVMAVGNPLGLADTVTTGIVSALNRPVTTQASEAQGSDSSASNAVVTNAIQTDAAINPGNSGGALVTANGQVIGINSSIASLSGGDSFGGQSTESGNIGLGFAIPVNEAKTVSQQLISTGSVKHPFLGVTLEDSTVNQAGAQRAAASINSVQTGTPAASAGLRKGDEVVSINGQPVDGALSLTAQVRALAVGDKVTLGVVRDGKQISIVVTVAARPSSG
jgi:putative serine protease PepD